MADLNMLVDMGFDKEKAAIALKKGGNLQGAIDWLEKNQDKSAEEIRAEEAEAESASKPTIQPTDADAKSYVCNECGKKLRDDAALEFHASKTQHTDFSQSVEEVKPLTEEEKKAKLEDLRRKLAEKRAMGSEQDKLDKKKNEEIRRKATVESQNAKEELQKKEQIKEAQKKRQEKLADIEAKKRVQEKIEADREARRLKAAEEKAIRAGAAPPPKPAEAPAPTSSGPVTSKPASAYTEARLRLQTPSGNVMKSFTAETTLFEVAHALEKENGTQASSFSTTFPKKTFDTTDFGMTVKEAGWLPSAALIVK